MYTRGRNILYINFLNIWSTISLSSVHSLYTWPQSCPVFRFPTSRASLIWVPFTMYLTNELLNGADKVNQISADEYRNSLTTTPYSVNP